MTFLDIWNVAQRMDVKKQNIFYNGLFGFSNWLESFYHAVRNSSQTSGNLKSKNVKLWIFPEGTRRNTGQIHKFVKRGAFCAAVQAQVPIVPIVFSSYKTFMDSNKKMFNEGEVIITILPPKPTKRLTEDDVDDLIQLTRDEMVNVFEKTSLETEERMLRS